MADEESATLLQFPRVGSRVYRWYGKYKALSIKRGREDPEDWLMRNVPVQFHLQIRTLYNLFKLSQKKRGKK